MSAATTQDTVVGSGRRPRRAVWVVGGVVAVALAVLAYVLLRPTGLGAELDSVHAATKGFQAVSAVESAGYGELVDVDGIACIDHHDQGAMGIHYVNGDLVGDAAVDPLRPEAIIYEPQASGSLELVGVEYVVLQEAWDAANEAPPVLFGQDFIPVGADNRYGIPAFYELHAWVWRDNPAGRFVDYNPEVTCEHAADPTAGGHPGDAADGEPDAAADAADAAAGSAADAAAWAARQMAAVGQPNPAVTRPPRLSGW